MKRKPAFRPTMGDATHKLEDRVVPAALFSFAPPAASAKVTYTVIHNQLFAPLLNATVREARAILADVNRGLISIEEAGEDLAALAGDVQAELVDVNADSDDIIATRHPFRGDDIIPTVDNVFAQAGFDLDDLIEGIFIDLDEGTFTRSAYNRAVRELTGVIRATYSGTRVAITSGGVLPRAFSDI